jgi:AraC-like DNA-binding protein
MVFSTTPPPPAVIISTFKDIADAKSIPGLFDEDGIQLQSERLHARRIVVHLPAVTLTYQATNLRLGTRTRVHDGMAAVLAVGPRASGTVDGLPICQDKLLLAPGGSEICFFVDPGFESIAVMAPPHVLRTLAAELRWDDGFREPLGLDVLRANPSAARALFRLGKRIAIIASKRPHILAPGSKASTLAQADLLDALFAATRSAAPIDPNGPARTQRSQGRIVRLAEDFALANLAERVHVANLCRITDVSERTLEGAFKQVTSLSPIAYLIRLRLHRVRAALLAADPGSTRVSAEAIKCGFWHFGDFSRAYKDCFGESPSSTLRREPGRTSARTGTNAIAQA